MDCWNEINQTTNKKKTVKEFNNQAQIYGGGSFKAKICQTGTADSIRLRNNNNRKLHSK